MLGFYEDLGISSKVYDQTTSPVSCDDVEQFDLPLCISRREEAELSIMPPCMVNKHDIIATLQDGQTIRAPIDGRFSEIVNVKLPRMGKLPCARILPSGPIDTEHSMIQPHAKQYTKQDILNALKSSAIADEFSGRRLYSVLTGNITDDTILCAAAFDDEPFSCANGTLFRLFSKEILMGLSLCSAFCCDTRMAVAVSPGAMPEDFDITGEVSIIEAPQKYPVAEIIKAKSRKQHYLFIGVHALLALYRTLAESRPVTGEYITIWGDKIPPVTVYARFGTPIYAVCVAAGIDGEVDRIVNGGVLSGAVISPMSVTYPGLCQLTVLYDTGLFRRESCSGCGRCVEVCPQKLMPLYIMQAYEQNDIKTLNFLNANKCAACGCCGFICSSHTEIGAAMPYIRNFLLKNNFRDATERT